jgi:putative ABC transport system substrate-binding protein
VCLRRAVGISRPSVGGHLQQIIKLADRHRLPAIYPQPGAATRGGLMYYGSDNVEIYRRAAS